MKSKRVLIVDDNDLNRKLFENLLSQLYQIDSAQNGQEALEKLERANFDLVLMDIQMPTLDGISAMKRIRKGNQSETIVVAITAFADESDRENFISMGFDDFLTKPIRPREFLDSIKSIINQESINPEPEKIEESEPQILNRKVISQLMKYNSREAMELVLKDFLNECEQILGSILEAKESEDFTTLTELLHSLKGNSGTLGAEKIYESAHQAELLAKKKMKNELLQSLDSLEKNIESFKKYSLAFTL